MNTKKIIKRVLALILTAALVMANVPTSNIFAENTATSEYETVTFDVNVMDSQDNALVAEDGVVFKLMENNVHLGMSYVQLTDEIIQSQSSTDSDNTSEETTTVVENATEEVTTEEATTEEQSTEQEESTTPEIQIVYTNTYRVTVDKKIGESLVLKVYEAGNPEHIGYINYSEGVDEYNVNLTKYASLNKVIYDDEYIDIDFYDGKYTYETDFDSSASEFIVSFKHPVNCEIVEETTKSKNVSVGKVGAKDVDNDTWKIDYKTAGAITVKVTPVEGCEYQFEETTLEFNINNKLEFLYNDNKNINGITIEVDEDNKDKIQTVKKTIAKDEEKVKLKLSALDSSNIVYSISNADGTIANKSKSYINSTDGTVTIKSAETVIVTATCSLTGEKAEYTLVPVPTVNSISANVTDKVKHNIIGIPFLSYTEYYIDIDISNVWNNKAYYDIDYSCYPSGIIDIDKETGQLTVKTMSDDKIKVTVTATPKADVYYYGKSQCSIDLNVLKIIPTAAFYYDNELLTADSTKILYDMNTATDLYKNEAGDWCLDIPIDAVLSYEGENLDNYNITLSSDGLEFDGNTITNADEILRNKEFTINVLISDDVAEGESKRFDDIPFSFTCILEGDKTYNDNYQYYNVTGLRKGLDGNNWKEYCGDTTSENIINVVATSSNSTYFVSEIGNEFSSFSSSCNINLEDEFERFNKDHIVYVMNSKTYEVLTTHLFFGVDDGLPTISADSIEYSGANILISDNCVYTNDSVTIKLNATDAEGNLFCARLYTGTINEETGKENYIEVPVTISQEDVNKGSASFTIDIGTFRGLYENFTVAFFDAAGNSSDRVELSNILIENEKPNGTINYIETDDVVIYEDEETGNIYASADLDLKLFVSDKMFASEEAPISGIKSYNVYINDVLVPELSKDYSIDNSCLSEYEKTVNTALYSTDGKVTVAIKDIVDMAGNTYNAAGSEGEEITFTIYIDKGNPNVVFANENTTGNSKHTADGNFYNSDVEYTFSVSDNMTGVKTVKLTIGDTVLEGNIYDGQVHFTIPLNTKGEVSITLEDKVGHTSVTTLNEIMDASQHKVFESSYVIVENKIEKPSISVLTKNSKGNWFNGQVAFNVDITDVVNGSLSSGLASYEIYINDVLCGTNVYTGREKLVDTISVVITKELIDRLINDDGSYTVKVIVTDNAGNVENDSETVFIDTIAPVISDLTGVVNNSINTGTVTVNVEVSEKHYKENGNKTVVTVAKTLDGQTETYEATPFTMNGKVTEKPYTFTDDGDYIVTVTSEDAAGNTAISKMIAFTIDNTAPLADITGVTANTYYLDEATATISVVESNFEDMNVVISITSELNDVIKTIDSVVFDKTQKTSAVTQTFAEEGRYTIKVDAVDAAGNVALTKTVIFTVDVSAPLISISGVENGAAYKDEIIPVITINDNYYNDYSISLIKNGVYFNEDMSGITSNTNVDVTELVTGFRDISNGVTGSFDTFEKLQSNDGIYTLTVSARDNAGRASSETVQFSVNRFGSVYTFDESLKNIMDTVNTSIDTDFRITEYNADKLVNDSVNISITRDGSPIDEVVATKTETVAGDSGWYQYDYVISKDNFAYDGVYVITVSSTDEAGNISENIAYDELNIRFSVDTTKPEVVKVTGLTKDTYNAENVVVNYEVFDAVGIKEVRVFLSGNNIQTVNEFVDITSYEGSFSIKEGMEQHIRFEVEDMAGNVVDSDNEEDVKLGKVVSFNNTITVSTSPFVRWYADKTLFYGSVAAAGTAVAGGGAAVGLRIRRRKLKVK